MPSNINPNNIDGAYPVAGQDNNSQGFRDNFTNIKTNFQFAEDEINDLQSKALLKSALVGTTLNNDMNGAVLSGARIQNFTATRVEIPTTSGAILVDYRSGNYQTIQTTDPITLSFTGFPAAGIYAYMKIRINITDVADTVTLPAAVDTGTSGIQGLSGNTISFAATGFYEFGFGTVSGGSSITIFDLNRALTNFTAADLSVDDITATGNVIATKTVTGGNITTGGTVDATGNITGGNIVTAGSISSTGNITGGNIVTGGVVSTTGNVQGVNVRGFVYPTPGTNSTAPVNFVSGARMNNISAGAIEFDGAAFTAAIAANQRGVVALDHFITLTSDASVTNGSSAQAVFPSNGAITLAAGTTYFMEAQYVVGPTGSTALNAVTMSTGFGVTSALTDVYYTADTTVGLATALTATKRRLVTSLAATVVTDAAAGGNASFFTVQIKGILRTNLATTVTPQMSFSGTPAVSGLRVLLSSYFRLQPVGNQAVLNVGNWG